jgi:flavin reductase (DIM6/NTAB) family NADH-FMN oxidoreductase RutF
MNTKHKPAGLACFAIARVEGSKPDFLRYAEGAGHRPRDRLSASTVNWVMQSAFAPPLVLVGVKTDSGSYRTVKAAQAFALNMLGKDHKSLAFTFFKPADLSDGKISGQAFRKGITGSPILIEAPGAIECRVTSIVEQGDHHIVVGEVIEAHLNKPPAGRPDAAILEMKDLGENVFYGG